MNASVDRNSSRWQLLATTSAFALAATLATQDASAADRDADHPTVWIELGGQLESLSENQERFVPPFILATPRPAPETTSPLGVEGAPGHSFGGEGKITIQPENSDWVFSAALRYGRSNANRRLHQQSYPTQPIVLGTPTYGLKTQDQKVFEFVDAENHSSETHAILDFQAGKDVGLGVFGTAASSVFNVGVRFAQFGSKSNITFGSDPDVQRTFKYAGGHKVAVGGIFYHTNSALASVTRSFHGVGPSLSWNASAPVLGLAEEGEIAFDWGVNAAILFGRQRARVHHQTTSRYHSGKYDQAVYTHSLHVFRTTSYRNAPSDQNRSRSVAVPNLGGFAGLSFRYAEAKVSLGYRADFFFGAMDGGIDAAHHENVGFYGPFTTISIGLGG